MSFDMIISNPPYISRNEWHTLDASVRAWEDTAALVAHENGTGVIKRIIEQSIHYIKQNDALRREGIPQLVIEIGYQQGPTVAALFQATGIYQSRIEKDLQGHDRIVAGYVVHEKASFT